MMMACSSMPACARMIYTAADVECHHHALTGALDGNGSRYECMASVICQDAGGTFVAIILW